MSFVDVLNQKRFGEINKQGESVSIEPEFELKVKYIPMYFIMNESE